MKILCVFGKFQYGDQRRGVGTEYAAFIPSLRKLGHEVVHFESWDRSAFRNVAELNLALLDTVDRERPDILFAVQMQYEIFLETLYLIRARGGVATLCWTTDDSWKYREVSRFIGPAYHAVTTTYPDVLPRYRRDGISHVLLTQWAAFSGALKEPLPAEKCRYEVSFIGAAHGNRKRRVEGLRKSGIEVACFGHGWPAGSIPTEVISKIVRESVISLNFANSRGQNQIKARTFEIPGAGGFLLTEAAPGLECFYTSGREIVTFENEADLSSKIRHYLAHPEERNAIALSGFQRTCRDHTYEIRFKEVLDFAVRSREEGPAPGKQTEKPDVSRILAAHRSTLPLRLLRRALLLPCAAIWKKERGARAARRFVFELSWRLMGRKTFTASGWPGRMFPKE